MKGMLLKPFFHLSYFRLRPLSWNRVCVARAAFVIRVFARGFFEVERGLAETCGEPVEEDPGLGALARPAGAVEHRERHRQRVVLARAVARELELSVETVDARDRLARGLNVLEAELAREELRVDVLRLRGRSVEVEVARVQPRLLQDGRDVRRPRARDDRDVLDLAHPRERERDYLLLPRRLRRGALRPFGVGTLRARVLRLLRFTAHQLPPFARLCRKVCSLLYHLELKIDCLPAYDEA